MRTASICIPFAFLMALTLWGCGCRTPPDMVQTAQPQEAAPDPFTPPWTMDDPTLVADISHHYAEHIIWDDLTQDGPVIAFIHKATEGDIIDKEYHKAKDEALRRGHLWGSFHLGRPGDPVAQADFYLDYAKPGPDEVIALDIEGADSDDMPPEDAVAFINRIYEKTGRYPLLYVNGSAMKAINKSYDASSVFRHTPLWYSWPPIKEDYAHSLPDGDIWNAYTLWQFQFEVNCKHDPEPCWMRIDGLPPDADINVYQGSREELRNEWPFTRVQ